MYTATEQLAQLADQTGKDLPTNAFHRFSAHHVGVALLILQPHPWRAILQQTVAHQVEDVTTLAQVRAQVVEGRPTAAVGIVDRAQRDDGDRMETLPGKIQLEGHPNRFQRLAVCIGKGAEVVRVGDDDQCPEVARRRRAPTPPVPAADVAREGVVLVR